MIQLDKIAQDVNQDYLDICKEVEEKNIEIDAIELKIAESKKYLSLLKKDKEDSNSVLSPYSKEDIIDEHIQIEIDSKNSLEEKLKEEKVLLENLISRKEKLLLISETFNELTNDRNILIYREELEQLINIVEDYNKESINKAIEMKRSIEAYVYFDPERTKQEIDNYIEQLERNSNSIRYRRMKEKLLKKNSKD